MLSAGLKKPAYVITACVLVLIIANGTRAGFGIFLRPMSMDLGWGREVFALAIAIQNLVWGLTQPIAGMISDRYGCGRVLVVSAVVYSLGLYVMSGASTPFELTMSGGILVGLALSGTGFPVVLSVVGRVVKPERRTLALGLATAGGSSGQMLVIPFGQGLINWYGWSSALLILAVLTSFIMPLAAWLAGPPAPASPDQQQQSMREALREASGHSGFWFLTAGFFVCGFHVMFIGTHLPAYLVDNGAAPGTGALALAIIGFGNIVGTSLCGLLGDRYRKKYVLSALYLGRSVLFSLFLLAPMTQTTVIAFSFAIGLLWLGTVPLTSGLVVQIFGLRYMATLFSIVFISHQLGSFLGAWYGGYVYDQTGSYVPVWQIGIVLGVLSAILHWPIRDTPIERALPQRV